MKCFKKFTVTLFAVLVLLGVLCTGTITVYAKDNHVTNIDIEVTVQEDGSAYIVQRWTGEFHKGTENYIPIRTGDIGISEFSVSDEKVAYTFVDNWDVDADFDEKVNKCGIVKTKNGVELCFGISEYGEKEYTIRYLVTDFIKSYTDYDGTNFMFINTNMSTFPTAGTIEIKLADGTALDASNAGIWAFGYEGQVEFWNGCVVAYTEEDLEDDNSMIVMLQLNKGLLSPKTSVDKSFEAVKEKAMEDSDYGHGDDGDAKTALAVLGVFVGSIIALAGVGIGYTIKREKEIKQFGDSVGYYTEVPNGGNIKITHYLAQTFDAGKEDSLIIGALMLSMMNERAIELRSTADAFGAAKETLELRLLREPDSSVERRLFYILSSAADGDGVLRERELEDYAFEHYEEIEKFIRSVKKDGETALQSQGGFVKNPGSRIKHLSEAGKAELAQVIGLKKYLEENVRMADHDIWEANLWQDYMVYATLFGIADKVIEQLKTLYPERIPVFEEYQHHYIWCYGYYHGMHSSMDRAMEEARAEGGGGSSSIGGGGGFSGGGSGGGSR